MNCSQIFCTFAVETTNRFFKSCESLVVNCSQIFCTFAVETTTFQLVHQDFGCELLSNFLYFCSRNNSLRLFLHNYQVVNCSQIFCTFAVETTTFQLVHQDFGCELLSNFLYFCSRNNLSTFQVDSRYVVNCSQIFCTFAVETTLTHISRGWNGCELLSNFLYFCSRNNVTLEY